jgi:hypothetical protein
MIRKECITTAAQTASPRGGADKSLRAIVVTPNLLAALGTLRDRPTGMPLGSGETAHRPVSARIGDSRTAWPPEEIVRLSDRGHSDTGNWHAYHQYSTIAAQESVNKDGKYA